MTTCFKNLLAGAAGPASLSPAKAHALVKSGAALLDVRSAAECKALSIPGSTHIPLVDLPGKLGTLLRGKTIVCQCASGARSAQDIFTAELNSRPCEGAPPYDVRERDEYEQGHIPGAINVPLIELPACPGSLSRP